MMVFASFLLVVPLVLNLFLSCTLASGATTSSNDQIELLFNAIVKKPPNVPLAHKIVNEFQGEIFSVISTDDYFTEYRTFPILHYMLNLYVVSKDPAEKERLLDILNKCISTHKFDASISSSNTNEPPLYIKLLLVKEISLLQKVIENNPKYILSQIIARNHHMAHFFKGLYALISDVVPISKLLLHAEEIIATNHNKNELSVPVNSTNPRHDALKNLLHYARLDNPTVKPVLLLEKSITFQGVIEKLSVGDARSKRITLEEIMRSIEEVIADIQQSIINIVNSSDRLEIAKYHWIDLLINNSNNNEQRNALHYLGISGSTVITHALLEHLFGSNDITFTDYTPATTKMSNQNNHNDQGINDIMRVMNNFDYRNHTSISYCYYRFGNHHSRCNILEQLLSIMYKRTNVLNHSNLLSDEDVIKLFTHSPVEHQSNTLPPTASEVTIDESGEVLLTPDVTTPSTDKKITGGWNDVKLTIDTTVSSPVIDSILNEQLTYATNSPNHKPRCDILEVFTDELPSYGEFFAKYINTNTPVIFRGIALPRNSTTDKYINGRSMRHLRRNFYKDKFLNKYGMIKVAANVLPYGDSFGVRSVEKSLKQVTQSNTVLSIEEYYNKHSIVKNLYSNDTTTATNTDNDVSSTTKKHVSIVDSKAPLYTFITPGSQWTKLIHQDVPIPEPLILPTTDSNGNAEHVKFELQFYLGAAGSGAPVHYHGHAINTLAYGEKQWILFPPSASFYSTLPALDFFLQPTFAVDEMMNTSSATPEKNVFYCTQEAGDVMYVPSLWGHGTLNTKQSIGVAHEFSIESFCME